MEILNEEQKAFRAYVEKELGVKGKIYVDIDAGSLYITHLVHLDSRADDLRIEKIDNTGVAIEYNYDPLIGHTRVICC